jgi:hypothetical protein
MGEKSSMGRLKDVERTRSLCGAREGGRRRGVLSLTKDDVNSGIGGDWADPNSYS